MDGLAPGAIMELPIAGSGLLVVTEVGRRPHSNGYGDVDFCAFSLSGGSAVGAIVNTPWGYGEIVAAPERCRLVRVSWDGKKTYGSPGTPSGIGCTMAAARAMKEDVKKLRIESC